MINIKYLFFAFIAFAYLQSTLAQKHDNFSITHQIPTTSVKNQGKTGTCWSFATISFIETEAIRLGNTGVNLSEMFIVKEIYRQKAASYVRFHGHTNFSEGGQAHDVFNAIQKVGLVPEAAYTGLNYGTTYHVHDDLLNMMESILKVVVDQKKPPVKWPEIIQSMLDIYLGETPESFTYKEKTYTPLEFMETEVGINPKDYIELTSYTHKPFYTSFVLEMPDNWSYDLYLNLPIDELVDITKNALQNGYSICWDGDVSETGFDHFNCSASLIFEHDSTVTEIEDYQQHRQETFLDWETTDDHLMHITGLAEDGDGDLYFLVKNSWGDTSNSCNGFLYMSVPYFKLKTLAIAVHKDALPKKLKKNAGVK